eukprot:snap_masked-scaffold_44-processed-gene-1.16-mRNA-1 protein AED:0.08 eAED:0.08 QI:0/-1/0/1/-1/1/1/0/537
MSFAKQDYEKRVSDTTEWMAQPRFAHTVRRHTAEQVVSLQGSGLQNEYLNQGTFSDKMSMKLWNLVTSRFKEGGFTKTFGALDPVQVAQMSKYLECIYISGWQSSSTASTTNEPGPDFADYPANTVPNKVDQLFRAQCFHDRRQYLQQIKGQQDSPVVDFLRPIIADGDTGFGGITSVMKLTKLMIEAGAAAMHIEDQKGGAKKCGHMGGKVLVSVGEHLNRLSAARLQADVMHSRLVLIARTDADGASFLETNIDTRDHPFIAGCTNEKLSFLAKHLRDGGDEKEWVEQADLKSYPDTICDAMRAKGVAESEVQDFRHKALHLSHTNCRRLATKLGYGEVFWCMERPRSAEGFYRIVAGVEYSAARAKHFAELADLVWMETAKPELAQAKEFSQLVHGPEGAYLGKPVPHLMLAYNLSPSFNWDQGGLFNGDEEIMAFQGQLGKLGFVWQFITLGGFHANSLAVDRLARAYASEKGVYAYVEGVQRKERNENVETLTHQKWSGAQYSDTLLSIASGGEASTSSLKGATEDQFKAKL